MKKEVTILTGDPTIEVIAEMMIDWDGVRKMSAWVASHRPECLPDSDQPEPEKFGVQPSLLFPHDRTRGDIVAPELSDNELLVELAGRTCYSSFGLKAGKKTNAEYIANTQSGEIPHASILYHAKMSFFFAGISRRVSHEIIRNYVGADRDEEGAPSQESTRFTHHYGFFIEPPRYLSELPTDAEMELHFTKSMQQAYDNYLIAVEKDCAEFAREHGGEQPKGIDKKRIYEAASSFLPHQAETSFVWTTNPAAIAKLCRERDNEAADLEIQRFARKLKRVSVERWPNLFPQSWMKTPPVDPDWASKRAAGAVGL
jgi:thymidylate synthase (FAD)